MKFFRNKKLISFAVLAVLVISFFIPNQNAEAQLGLGDEGREAVRDAVERENQRVENQQDLAEQNNIELNEGDSITEIGDGSSGIVRVDRADGGYDLYKDGVKEGSYAAPPGGLTDEGVCSLFKGVSGLTACVRDTFGFISVVLIYISGLILWVAAQIFEILLQISIINFSSIANNPGVTEAWGAIRDLANIFFIFIMLYIAIGTILDLPGVDAKRMVTKLVIIALLINFSMPITRAIIDSGNILSLWLYRQITPAGRPINESIMAAVNPAKLVDLPGTNIASDIFTGSKPTLGNSSAVDIAEKSKGKISVWDVIVNGLGATVVILVLAFMFFAAGFMFLARTIWLVLLIIVSPFAYFLSAFPQGAKFAPSLVGQFWDKLLNQTFFAPVYLALLWIAFQLITADGITQIFSADGASGGYISKTASDTIGPIIYFVFVVALLIAALVSAGQMGAAGAGYFKKLGEKWQKGIRGAVGRNTVGRAAFLAANSGIIRGFAKAPVVGGIGRSLQRGLDAGANMKFVDGKGYAKVREDSIKQHYKNLKRAATDQKTGETDQDALDAMIEESGSSVRNMGLVGKYTGAKLFAAGTANAQFKDADKENEEEKTKKKNKKDKEKRDERKKERLENKRKRLETRIEKLKAEKVADASLPFPSGRDFDEEIANLREKIEDIEDQQADAADLEERLSAAEKKAGEASKVADKAGKAAEKASKKDGE